MFKIPGSTAENHSSKSYVLRRFTGKTWFTFLLKTSLTLVSVRIQHSIKYHIPNSSSKAMVAFFNQFSKLLIEIALCSLTAGKQNKKGLTSMVFHLCALDETPWSYYKGQKHSNKSNKIVDI